MYDELVATLRRQCAEMDCGNCNTCVKNQAADAIENLSVVVRAQKAVLDKFPKWIPVTERLIHSGLYLVVCNEWGGSAVRKAIYDEATRKWLEFPCGGTKDITKFVTHWMPLPEPPKEDSHE